MNFNLGGGGRFAAYAKAHGYQAAVDHCNAKYGAGACQAMHKHGTQAAPYARASQKSRSKGDFPSFDEWMARHGRS